jgi:hypothetical protein
LPQIAVRIYLIDMKNYKDSLTDEIRPARIRILNVHYASGCTGPRIVASLILANKEKDLLQLLFA